MMEIKSRKKILKRCLTLYIFSLGCICLFSQCENEIYDSISSDKIMINSKTEIFDIQTENIRTKFGSNYNYSENFIEELFPGELSNSYPVAYYKYEYNGLEINFYSYEKRGKKYLNYYLLSSNTFSISINNNIIKIGDNYIILKGIFPNSYCTFIKSNEKRKSDIYFKVKIVNTQFIILIEVDFQTKKIKTIKLQNTDNMA